MGAVSRLVRAAHPAARLLTQVLWLAELQVARRRLHLMLGVGHVARQWGSRRPGPTTDMPPAAARHLAMPRRLDMGHPWGAMVHHLEATEHSLDTAHLHSFLVTVVCRPAWVARHRRHSGHLDRQDTAYQTA